jgi:hypothetical protein
MVLFAFLPDPSVVPTRARKPGANTMTRTHINIGDTLTCAETGKQFIAARDGCTTNYATNDAGEVFSDEGVHIRDMREFSHRAGPVFCYLGEHCATVTGWKGNVLGNVTRKSVSRTGFHGSTITHVRVRDLHGKNWHGKGAGPCMCITLHPCKS